MNTTSDISEYYVVFILYGSLLLLCLLCMFISHARTPKEHKHSLLVVNDLTEHEMQVLRSNSPYLDPPVDKDIEYAANK